MNAFNLSAKRTKGFAIPLAILALVVLFVTGTGLLYLGLQNRTYAIRTSSDITARCAADTGITKALFILNEQLQSHSLNDNDLPAASSVPLPGAKASFSYTVTRVGETYTINSIGSSVGASREVQAILKLTSPFENAIYTKEDLTLYSGAVVDWYNYDDDDEAMKIGTLSTGTDKIELKNGAYINGDVVVGVGANPDDVIRDLGATITGEKTASFTVNTLDPVTVPEWLDLLPSGGNINNNKTITTSGKYSAIDLGSNEKLVIDGQVVLYITGDMTLSNSAELQIVDAQTNPDASLVLYIGGDIEVKNGGDINNETTDAGKLEIYGLNSCQEIIFKNSSDFYGAIYAPNAEVEFMNSADAYGAVAAKEFEQKNSSSFHYDASLREVEVDDEAVFFTVERWQE